MLNTNGKQCQRQGLENPDMPHGSTKVAELLFFLHLDGLRAWREWSTRFQGRRGRTDRATEVRLSGEAGRSKGLVDGSPQIVKIAASHGRLLRCRMAIRALPQNLWLKEIIERGIREVCGS